MTRDSDSSPVLKDSDSKVGDSDSRVWDSDSRVEDSNINTLNIYCEISGKKCQVHDVPVGKTLNKLYNTAISILGVPASSFAVECIFSHGGILMHPHRAWVTNKLFRH